MYQTAVEKQEKPSVFSLPHGLKAGLGMRISALLGSIGWAQRVGPNWLVWCYWTGRERATSQSLVMCSPSGEL